MLSVTTFIKAEFITPRGITKVENLMYQNQHFSIRDKRNFEKQKEGGRVWTWSGAKKYCKELTLGGYSGWRLPTKTELSQLATVKLYKWEGHKNHKKWLNKNRYRQNKSSNAYQYFIKKEFVENMPPLNGLYKLAIFWTSIEKDPISSRLIFFGRGTERWGGKLGFVYTLCVR